MKYKWAKREIKLWEKQKPENFICELNGEQLGKTVLKMCKVLCDEIHNYSCYAEVLRIFTKLSELKPLTPVYGDEGEWEAACIGYTYLIKGVKAYRNKRMSSSIGGRIPRPLRSGRNAASPFQYKTFSSLLAITKIYDIIYLVKRGEIYANDCNSKNTAYCTI